MITQALVIVLGCVSSSILSSFRRRICYNGSFLAVELSILIGDGGLVNIEVELVIRIVCMNFASSFNTIVISYMLASGE